jgi:hypothetical protein
VVEVVGCVPLAEAAADPFAVGPWCWLLARARRIPVVPFKGQVSLFDLPDQVVVPSTRNLACATLSSDSQAQGRASELHRR